MTLAVDQEFGEIPTDIQLSVRIGLGFFKVLVKGIGVIPVNFDLIEKGKGHVVFAGAKSLDFRVGPGFLLMKLVAGKAQDHESFVLVFLIKLF